MASREQYKEFFEEADKNQDKTLTKRELIELLRRKGHKGDDAEISKYFESLDYDDDGKLTVDEFLAVIDGIPPQKKIEMALRSLFKEFDRDGNGTIDKAESSNITEQAKAFLSEEQVQRMIELFDANDDGKLDFEEFLASYKTKALD